MFSLKSGHIGDKNSGNVKPRIFFAEKANLDGFVVVFFWSLKLCLHFMFRAKSALLFSCVE